MNTETKQKNKYAKELEEKSMALTVENLLIVMAPDVDALLIKYGYDSAVAREIDRESMATLAMTRLELKDEYPAPEGISKFEQHLDHTTLKIFTAAYHVAAVLEGHFPLPNQWYITEIFS